MDFAEVIRRQRMVRPPYQDRPIPKETLDEILAAAQKAPSAGFSQGMAFVVLEGERTDVFWELTMPQADPGSVPKAPVVIVPLEHKQAYLDRYSEPDKQATGLGGVAEAWPVPYWTVDTSFASMVILLAATAHGIGGWFFGIFAGEAELLRELGVPDGFRPIGAIALGYGTPDEFRSPSLKRGRKPFDDFIHKGGW
jgi:nitroreductase